MANFPDVYPTNAVSVKLTFASGWMGFVIAGDVFGYGDTYSGGLRYNAMDNTGKVTTSGLVMTYGTTFKGLVVVTFAGSRPTYSAS